MHLTFYFQGEPFIHPSLLEMIQKAHREKIYTMVSTNGHFLDPDTCHRIVLSGLDRIIVSLDGLSQEIYQKYRIGGKVEKVIEGIKNLVKIRKEHKANHPYIILQTIVFSHNESELEQINLLAKELEVDQIEFKTAQIYDYSESPDLIPEQSLYARYFKNEEGKFEIKNKLSNQCWRMWQGCVITWDGKVVPCCFDKDATHQLGQLMHQPLKEIWRSKAYYHFRQNILQSRKSIDICTNCTEGGFT